MHEEVSVSIRGLVARLSALALCACVGGGSGAGTGAESAPPLPELSEDINPPGERLDHRARNYFPAAPGDEWTYDVHHEGGPGGETLTRAVTAGTGGDVFISETTRGKSTSSTYRRTPDGVVELRPWANIEPDSLAAHLMSELLLYPEPFYPVGSTRRVIRQGNWGPGYGETNAGARVELTQTFVGFETLDVPNAKLSDVAHFHNILSATVQPVAPQSRSRTVTFTEETWWAPGVGLIRAKRSLVSTDGAAADLPYTLEVTGATVGGKPLLAAPLDGTVVDLDLSHGDLVYDRSRTLYYASVPGNVPVHGNRIAVIDPATGAVSYPGAPVGSDPGALAMTADGTAIYVGLDGAGDVLKLRLPDLAELWRVRLPNDGFYGQLFAANIAVSPIDPDVIAVSMFRTSVSPRHGGVALVRAGVLQPTKTQDHTGSNLIVFDPNGEYVYGFNNESSEFGLRRLAVLPDGLEEESVVSTESSFETRTLDWTTNGLVLDRALYRTPDLTLVGRANVQGGRCRAHTVASRLVCAIDPGAGGDGSLAVVDATNFVILAKPAYRRGRGSWLVSIVPGPAGQVALRTSILNGVGAPADKVSLFTAPALQ
jgi:DNA-binding beta-propeller fold protein YncE